MEIITQEFETPTVDGQGKTVSLIKSSARILIEPLEKQVLLEMAYIPVGIFKMGSPGRQGYEDEHPQHIVSIAPFWIGKKPVTQEQWLSGNMPAGRAAHQLSILEKP